MPIDQFSVFDKNLTASSAEDQALLFCGGRNCVGQRQD